MIGEQKAGIDLGQCPPYSARLSWLSKQDG
jgi:hypothetical protein